jgi:predicted nucleic acid-binding protein
MYVLDTNVVSEIFRPVPDPNVATWLETSKPSNLYVTAVTKAESLTGLARMPEGRRRQSLHALMHAFFENRMKTPVLAFDSRSAEFFAEIVAGRYRRGLPVGEFDAQIAAIARAHEFAIVTRNVIDFEHCGIQVINPWEPR